MISKVSVIIPTYNCKHYICEAIDSVLAQSYKNTEIIVVDDGSIDATQEVISKYGEQIKYIYQTNKGVSSARNRGISLAEGEYIAFLDSDDVWLPDKLKLQISAIEKNTEAVLVFTDAEVFNEKGIVRNSFRPSHIEKADCGSFRCRINSFSLNDGSILAGDFYRDLLMGNFIALSTVLIRKELFSRNGGFDESFSIGEDYELWLRIARKNSLLYLNNITTQHRFRDDSASGVVNLRGFSYQEYDAGVLEKQYYECSKQYRDLIRARVLSCYKGAGWGYLHLKDMKKVRKLCLRSLAFNLFQAKIWIYFFYTFLPDFLIKLRSWEKSKYNA